MFRASTSVRLVGNSYCDIFGFFISTGRFQYQYRKVKNHLKKHATVRTKPLCPGFLGKKSTKAFDRAIPSVQGASCTKSSTGKIHFINTYLKIVFLPPGTPPSQTLPPTKPQPKLRNSTLLYLLFCAMEIKGELFEILTYFFDGFFES